ncbi:MAG TPA: LLM class flavin-dependent oxidoreductase [Solirubrobacteraceae bacterium]|nr:LLM class flavin-dependent oxidoreductase [Solirubrobacteraceae bacterium]
MHVLVGVFVVPDASDPARTLAQIEAADRGGLDLVGIQDHPYQRRFLDTWTLLSYAAARTEHVRLVPDVANLPLRPPAVLAKAAASLDVLSGGRVELGLGAGAFWDAIAAMGGPVRSAGESVDALVEAIRVIRAMWSDARSVRLEGEHYELDGVHPGPAPAHPIGIWLGAYGPRMLRVTGRLADGWLPSVPRLPLDEVPARQAAIDEAARAAGRDPSAILRAANVGVGGELEGVDGLARLVDRLRFRALFLPPGGEDSDPVDGVRRVAEDVAPALRARLAGG